MVIAKEIGLKIAFEYVLISAETHDNAPGYCFARSLAHLVYHPHRSPTLGSRKSHKHYPVKKPSSTPLTPPPESISHQRLKFSSACRVEIGCCSVAEVLIITPAAKLAGSQGGLKKRRNLPSVSLAY